jgi:hypothetical protein
VSTIVLGVPPAEMSEEQRLAALAMANNVRVWRAKVKRELKNRERPLAPLLLPCVHERLQTMRVFELLAACPRIGRVKADTICREIGVRPSVYLPGLSKAQLQKLVVAVEGSARSHSA